MLIDQITIGLCIRLIEMILAGSKLARAICWECIRHPLRKSWVRPSTGEIILK